MTNIIMILIVLFLFCLLVINAKYKDDTSHFFNLENTNALRGFWCLIVILVHIPYAYQNKLQDMIGSFAFIGVTFFFLTSAYGLKIGLNKDKNYLNHFWKKRLLKLLIPCLITNIIGCLIDLILGKSLSIYNFIMINSWVILLLLCYLIFYIVYKIFGISNKSNILVSLLIFIYSICAYIFKDSSYIIGWPYEVLGFIYGILLLDYKNKLIDLFNNKWIRNIIIFALLSLISGVLYLKFKTIAFVGEYLLKVILGIVITLLILCINIHISLGNSISKFLGNISYEVYLLHNAAFSFVAFLFKDINSGLFILLSLIITIILSYIANLLCNIINKRILKI